MITFCSTITLVSRYTSMGDNNALIFVFYYFGEPRISTWSHPSIFIYVIKLHGYKKVKLSMYFTINLGLLWCSLIMPRIMSLDTYGKKESLVSTCIVSLVWPFLHGPFIFVVIIEKFLFWYRKRIWCSYNGIKRTKLQTYWISVYEYDTIQKDTKVWRVMSYDIWR